MANACSSVNLLNSDLSFLFPGVSNKTLQDTNNSTTTKTMQTPNTELLAANNSLKQSRNVERSKKYNCAILNCNAEFCSDQNLQNHNVLFRHSPCNPCLLILNLQTPLEPQCYMCPECDQEFWDQTACQEHMLESLHLPFYPPLVITAYMCAQCLYLFENLESCWRHIEQMSHEGFYYPFSDEASGSNCLSGPIPVAKELVNDLVWKCNEVAYSVQCLECSLVIESRHQLLQHVQETQNQHLIASMTETSLVDIFTSYITDFSCNVCHRLFIADPKENTKHQCAQSLSGTIIRNDIHSFLEFIKRCALTLVRSIDPSDEASRNQTAASSVVTQHHIESFIKQLATKRSSLINEIENNPASRFEQNSNSVLTSVPGTSVKLFKNFALDVPDVIVVSDSDVSDSEDYVIDLTDVTPRVSDASGQSSTESESYLTSTEHLQTMKNIVFLDLDNWCSFFQKLPRCLPDKTFVWGFYGGRRPWFPPQRSLVFHRMSSLGLFYLNEQCGTSKDAADFAIVLTVGTMNERLPTEVSFTILSGDTGFHEVERQMRKSKRRVMVINPHKAASISSDMIYALVTSVTET